MIDELVGRTQIDDFLMQLSRLCIIEVGVVSAHDVGTGKCKINLYRVYQGQQQVLNDVELLWIGNGANCLQSDPVGSHCLVFFPRTPVPSLRDNLVKTRTRDYDFNGAKAILLSTGQASQLHVGFDSFGQFQIQSKDFVLTINEEGIELRNADATSNYTFRNDTGLETREGGGNIVNRVETDGSVEIQYRTTDGKVAYRMHFDPTGSYTVQRGAFVAFTPEQEDDPSSYTNWAWETIYNRDNSVSIKQLNDGEEALNTITVTPEGDINITNKKGSVIDVKQDGTISITGQAGIVINGDSGKVSVKNGTSDVKTLLDDFADSMQQALDNLKTILDALQTAGSPANHTAVPGQFDTWQQQMDQAISDWKDAVAGVLE